MNERPNEAVYRHTHLLGTVVEIRVAGDGPAACEAADRTIVDEITRLEAVFSVYDEHSELNRWKHDKTAILSPELVEVMSAALEWQRRSKGAFNPMSGILSDRWLQAECDGELPSPDEMLAVAHSIAEPRFVVDDGAVLRSGDCDALNLNAIAKGFIVDRACELAASRDDVSMVLVSAGGDMLHRGSPSVRAGIENPLRPYDNEPSLTVIDLHDAGLATSGGSRRGFRIGGQRLSHVIDPRTGAPVDRQSSISVVAPSAMEADVLATALGMAVPSDAVEDSENYPGCACLIIGVDGSRWPNIVWVDSYGDPRPSTSA